MLTVRPSLINNMYICISKQTANRYETSQDRFFALTVNDIMSAQPKMVRPETKITEIEPIMQANKIHSVLVVDDQGHLLDIVDSFRTMI